MQSFVRLIYPPHCVICAAPVAEENGLCGTCWRDTPFIVGLVCDRCGLPLPGDDPTEQVLCDDCQTLSRPWDKGRSALIYRDAGRRIVLSLKHSDRTDLAEPAARWMARAAEPLLEPGQLIAPMPLHWRRLLSRRYNQAALLGAALAQLTGLEHCPDLLRRTRATPPQKGVGVEQRYKNVADAISVRPGRSDLVRGRSILLIDDVMTSGASLAMAAQACHAAQAAQVRVLTLARAVKDD